MKKNIDKFLKGKDKLKTQIACIDFEEKLIEVKIEKEIV